MHLTVYKVWMANTKEKKTCARTFKRHNFKWPSSLLFAQQESKTKL